MQKSDWKKCKLGDICALVIDHRGKTPKKLGGDWEHVPFGYRALSAKNIKMGQIVQEDSIKYVNEFLYKKWMKDEIQYGDILITSEAPFGQVYLWNSHEKIVLSQRLFGLRIKKSFSPRFIYYYMTTQSFQAELEARATGTTVIGLRQPELLNCSISYPPDLEEQKQIAGILGALDDKIELLQKQNKTLEDMAKALFKSWFVDFDIVHAKQKGTPKAEVMREYHLTDELYDLFPSSFEDSSLGPIPLGWQVKNAGELLAFSIGGGWGNEEESQDFPVKAPVIRGTDIPILRSTGSYKSAPVRFHKSSNHKSRLLQEGDIVLEVAGGSKGQPVGRALFVGNYILKNLPQVICASFCKLLRPNKKLLLPELFYLCLDAMYQTGEIEQYQVQSTGISNFQFKQFCEDKEFVVPPQKLQESLPTKLYIEKIGNNKQQIQTLTELRDALLPRLISGKIRV